MSIDNHEFNQYNAEVQQKWGKTDAYKEYTEKTDICSNNKCNDLVVEMDGIMFAFAVCIKNGDSPCSATAQDLVKTLQEHITANYYNCTNEILAGLGLMYVCDERFKNNIDKHSTGTAEFICEAIKVYCNK